MGVTVWIARWSDQSEEEQDRSFYIVTLAVLALAAVIISVLRAVLTFFALVKVNLLRCYISPPLVPLGGRGVA